MRGWLARPFVAFLAVLAVLTVFWAPAVSRADVEDELPRLGAESARLKRAATKLDDLLIGTRQLRGPQYVVDRLTEGELYYRLRDYTRASILFTDLVDNFRDDPSYPDALFFLGDSLFLAGDYLGARTHFRALLARANESQFAAYVQRALGRVIEIAIHTRDFSGVEEHFQRLNRLPPSEMEANTQYVRGKFSYFRNDLDPARAAFEGVTDRSPYFPHARYFIGVIYTKQAAATREAAAKNRLFGQAVESFQRAASYPARTAEQRSVVDLAWLSLGRLFYELEQLEQAISAFEHISRTSRYFDQMMYEIAWVFIRGGDAIRAERALEVMVISNPQSRLIPDAKILRGNLLVRSGRFDDALRVFREVVTEFGPIKQRLEQIMTEHRDPQQYFHEMVRSNIEVFDVRAFLPEQVVEELRGAPMVDRALSSLEDLATCSQYVRESNRLIRYLSAALAAPNKVTAFAEFRRARERSLIIENRVAQIRGRLTQLEEEVVGAGGGSGDLAQVRQERRGIERAIGRLPTSDEDFDSRDEAAQVQWRLMSQQLHLAILEVDHLEAVIVATERFVHDTMSSRQQDAQGLQALQNELTAHRQAIGGYRRQIDELRIGIQAGRLQIGVGDPRYQRDDTLRQQYMRLVARERQLLQQSGRMGSSEARQIEDLLRELDAVDATVAGFNRRLDDAVAQQAAEVQRVVDQERARLAVHEERIARLQDEAQDVIGSVVFGNFRNVRRRFYDLILRADVGVIDVSWARREEHRTRIEAITEDRRQQIQALDDEFREVMGEEAPAEQAEGAGTAPAVGGGGAAAPSPRTGGAAGGGESTGGTGGQPQ